MIALEKININEVEDFNSHSFFNNSFEEENSLDTFKENTQLDESSQAINIFVNSNNSEINTINIPENRVVNRNLGRKKKGSGEKGEHDKYDDDNLIRKSKKEFRDAIYKFTNSKIRELDFQLVIKIDNQEYEVKKLLNLGQTLVKESSVEENEELFQSPIKNILYEISGKYKKYPENFNIVAIDELSKNPNEKCQKIANFLNLDYLDCLKYYRRDKDALEDHYLDSLKGLELKFDELPKILRKQGHEKDYEESLIYIIKHIEHIYDSKTARESRK